MARDESSRRLEFLDVARGLAALLVLVEHAIGPRFPAYRDWSAVHGGFGRIGVVLFLVISGFIIPLSLERGQSNARFWLRRFFRLFPAYWLSIAIGYAYVVCWNDPPMEMQPGDAPNWLLNLTMLQGFFNKPHVWGVFWTLQLELVLYAACSLLYACGLTKRWVGLVTVFIVGYLAIGCYRPLVEGKPFGVGGLRYLYFTPLMGVLAQCYVSGRLSRRAMYCFLLGQLASIGAIWTVNRLILSAAEMTAECLWEFALVWGTAYACFFGLAEMRHWTMPRVGCWLGRISFSVYLLHPVVLLLVWNWPMWAFGPGFLIGTLVLAELSYRYVELPGIALGRWVENRWWPKAAPIELAPLRQKAA